MRLSALLLTLVIALGATVAEAKTKHKTAKPPKAHHSGMYKAPKVKHKPAKQKPMKFRKAKARKVRNV